jgi:hypothetical protein
MTNEAHALNNYLKNMVHEESMERFILFTIWFVLIYYICKETALCCAAYVEEIFLQ